MAKITQQVSYSQNRNVVKIHVHLPESLPVADVRAFIYVPNADRTNFLKLYQNIVAENGVLSFESFESQSDLEYQILAVNTCGKVLAWSTGVASELYRLTDIALDIVNSST